LLEIGARKIGELAPNARKQALIDRLVASGEFEGGTGAIRWA
jgi:hypothetical protein